MNKEAVTTPRNLKSYATLWRAFNWLCVLVVLVLLGVRTWTHRGPNKASTLPVREEMSDYKVNTWVCFYLCRDPDHRYWRDFVYPPPAVLLWNGFAKLGYPAGALAWLGLLFTSLTGSLLLAMRLTTTGPPRQAVIEPPNGVLLALAFAATEYYSLWDLHVVNTNSIYLFLVLIGLWCWLCNQRVLAGLLLAASVALKIYSVVFLPFLLLRREWRVALAMLLSLVLFFVAVPAAGFGIAGALEITRNWLHTVSSAGGPDYLLHYSGYKISLSWMAMLLLDPHASDGKLNVLDWSPPAVLWLVRLVQAAWVLLVGAYFAFTRPLPFQSERGRLALALDASVLLLLALPLSPFLQPPHPVVLLLPAIALLRYAFGGRAPANKRAGAALTVASGCLVELTHYPWRGIGVMLTIALFFVGIWMVRRDLEETPESPPPAPADPGGAEPVGGLSNEMKVSTGSGDSGSEN